MVKKCGLGKKMVTKCGKRRIDGKEVWLWKNRWKRRVVRVE